MDALALEWNDYARTAWFASVVPMMEITISSEAVFLTNQLVQTPDGNHAALLRTSAEDCDAMIRRVISFYQERGLTPCVAVSSNCQPANLALRLASQGFKPYGDPESWLVLGDLLRFESARGAPNCTVHPVSPDDLDEFCDVMANSYGMPAGAGFILNHFFSNIGRLPGINNYLARVDGSPAGCLSMFHYNGVCAMGSASTLPEVRSLALGGALLQQASLDWIAAGRPQLVTQTVLPRLESILVRLGFRRAFSRTYYILE